MRSSFIRVAPNLFRRCSEESPVLTRSPRYSTISSDYEEKPSLWFKSGFEDIPVVEGLTIPELIRENIGGWGHLTAFECATTGVKYTNDEILRNAEGVAAVLIQSGFNRGDVVSVVLPNCPEYPSVNFGIWNAGLIASPVNPSYTKDEIRRQLLNSDSKCVITSPEVLQSVRLATESNPNIKSIIIVGEAHEGCHTFKEMMKTDTFTVQLFKGSQVNTKEEIAFLPYSSGTTRPPKGVMITHSNLTTNLHQMDPKFGISIIRKYTTDGGQARHIGVLPFYHSYGLSSIIHVGMFMGAHTLCVRKFELPVFLQAIRQHRPTALHLVPPLISRLVQTPEFGRNDLEDCDVVKGAAAPIGATLINKMLERNIFSSKKALIFLGILLNDVNLQKAMTELSPTCFSLNASTRNKKIGSCGSPIPNTIAKIIDVGTVKTLGRNERGEILVKGPQVMKGYLKNEEATRNTIDNDGWLHTGDVGYFDEDDCCFIVDRIKELIKVKGMQVAPSELEDLIREIPGVEDAAVIGVPAGDTSGAGELPSAYVVRKSNQLTEDALNNYLKDRVTHYKQLKGGIEWVDNIPKATSFKILRRELLQNYKQQRGIN